MKVLRKFGHTILRFIHYFITIVISILLLLLLSVFLFFVSVKTNPNSTEKFIEKSLSGVMNFFDIKHKDMVATIANDKIEININTLFGEKGYIKFNGNNIAIRFALNDIMHGRLYTINVGEFFVDGNTKYKADGGSKNKQSKDKKIFTKLYSLIPSVRVEIDNFFININENKIHLKNFFLVINQGGYIAWMSTKSQEAKYKIHIALDTKNLRISFTNVPQTLITNYSNKIIKFLDFNTISGFVEFNSQNLKVFRYNIKLDSLKILKNDFIPLDLLFGSINANGESDEHGVSVSIQNAIFNKDGKISINANIGKKEQSIAVKLQNSHIEDLKSLVPHDLIKKTRFKKLTQYLTGALKSGHVQEALINVNLPITKPDDLMVDVAFSGAEFEYSNIFAPVKTGDGIVSVNAKQTIVLLDNGESAGNKLSFTRVEVDHRRKTVQVNTDIKGTPLKITKILLPHVLLQKYNYLIDAQMHAQLDLKLNLECKNAVFECSSFNVASSINNLQSSLSDKKSGKGFLSVQKKAYQDITSEINFTDIKNKYFSISKVQAGIDFDIPKHKFKINARVFDNDKKIIDVKSFIIDTKGHSINMLDVQRIFFGHNDFSFYYNKQDNKKVRFKIDGNIVHTPFLYEIISRAKMQSGNQQLFRNKITHNFNADVDVHNIMLHNGIQTPLLLKLVVNNDILDVAHLDSNLIKFSYFVNDKFMQDYNKDAIFLDIPSLHNLFSALSRSSSNVVRSGNISIVGKRESQGEVMWSGYLRNLHIKKKKFKFYPMKSKVKLTYKDHRISYENLKMRDNNHTVFFTGSIDTQKFTTNTKIFYTPSKVEFLNEIPFLKNAFQVTTLGNSNKGLISLELKVTDSIFEPEIKFKKSSSVTSVWKFSTGVLLLPILLI